MSLKRPLADIRRLGVPYGATALLAALVTALLCPLARAQDASRDAEWEGAMAAQTGIYTDALARWTSKIRTLADATGRQGALTNIGAEPTSGPSRRSQAPTPSTDLKTIG